MVCELHVVKWYSLCKHKCDCLIYVLADHSFPLQVNWPKLITPRWATEAYQDTMSRVFKDKVVGGIVARHDRSVSGVRMSQMEEGKKRIQ